MTSFDQRIANRANSAKSTGPTSPEGKQVSRANALCHGVTATTVLLDDEDKEQFAELRLTLIEELEPESVMEMQLADRFVNLVWRSRRIAVFEAAILAWMGHWSSEYYDLSGYEKDKHTKHECQERLQKFHNGLAHSRKKRPAETQKKLVLGRLLHEEMNHNLIAKLSRYEAHLLTQLRRTHRELLDEQRRRIQREGMAAARRRIDEELAEEARLARDKELAAEAGVDIDMHYGTNCPRRSPEPERPRKDGSVPRIWQL